MSEHDGKNIADEFYINETAVLYGLIARRAHEVIGIGQMRRDKVSGFVRPDWEKTIISCLRAYCGERGLRMATRALADGEPLSAESYLIYGEWADSKKWFGAGDSSFLPHYTTRVTFCPWRDAWKAHGLLEYGALYCRAADFFLVGGFNPDIRFDMGGVLSHGDASCEYLWLDCNITPEEEKFIAEKRAVVADRVTKDFLYHCGHMLHTFGRELCLSVGLVKGRAVIRKAMSDFAELFGKGKAAAVAEASHGDFLNV
ncbi:hypothetical protein FACS1894167_03970 [Synergistales bacterium]|nr:hypothetical protein FACS1894167_03970 [Synergistales bacterium]